MEGIIKKIRHHTIESLGVVLAVLIIQAIAEGFKTNIVEIIKSLFAILFIGANDRNSLFMELGYTLSRFFVGYVSASILGVSIGIVLASKRKIDVFFKPIIEIMRPVPSAVVIPLSLAGLGIGEWMKYFVVWYGAFWPILIVTRECCRNIDREFILNCKLFHLNYWQTILMVGRNSLPDILGVLKSSLSIALLLAVTVEMIAGGKTNGLGYFILDSERSFEFVLMLAGVLLLAVSGFILNQLFDKIGKIILEKRYNHLMIGVTQDENR